METLRNKSMSQICEMVEQLIGIIMDQDHLIQILNGTIANLEDDGR